MHRRSRVALRKAARIASKSTGAGMALLYAMLRGSFESLKVDQREALVVDHEHRGRESELTKTAVELAEGLK